MKNKHKLDEMQERKLLKLEEAGFWLIFWLLFAAIILQVIINGDVKAITGELVVLIVASVYIAFTSLKNGVWSKSSAPTLKANILTSFVPALLLGVFQAVRAFVVLKKEVTTDLILKIVGLMLIVYTVCLVLLEAMRGIYNKRRNDLDAVGDEDGQ